MNNTIDYQKLAADKYIKDYATPETDWALGCFVLVDIREASPLLSMKQDETMGGLYLDDDYLDRDTENWLYVFDGGHVKVNSFDWLKSLLTIKRKEFIDEVRNQAVETWRPQEQDFDDVGD